MEPKINIVNAELSGEPYTTTIAMAHHSIIADEPLTLGGADKGPKPHDILIAALASCTCITISMYARRKGWELLSVTCKSTMERVVQSGVQHTKVHQQITFDGSLNDEMKQRLMDIGRRCPVHKTLAPAMEIISVMN